MPEHVSKMGLYLEALDREVKKENENPSVGIKKTEFPRFRSDEWKGRFNIPPKHLVGGGFAFVPKNGDWGI